jgi:hypothetical protein
MAVNIWVALHGIVSLRASRTGQWLYGRGVRALYASPMRRARETADGIASATGLTIRSDARLAERLNWDGSQPFDAFLRLWARSTSDDDGLPPQLLVAGIPPCAVTTIDGLTVAAIASTAHLP